jgi:hypothetical protein
MRDVHRGDCDDRCNGDWCQCSCHGRPLVPADGDEPDLAAEYERAKRAALAERVERAKRAGLQQGLVQFPDGEAKS